MRQRCIAAVVGLAACGEGVAPPEPPETPTFVPQLCTAGRPGEPTCPITQIPLDDLGVAATFAFVAAPSAHGLLLDELRVTAGARGVYLEHPRIIRWDARGPIADDSAPLRDLVLAIPPNTARPIAGTVALDAAGASRLSIQFAVLEAYQP